MIGNLLTFLAVVGLTLLALLAPGNAQRHHAVKVLADDRDPREGRPSDSAE